MPDWADLICEMGSVVILVSVLLPLFRLFLPGFQRFKQKHKNHVGSWAVLTLCGSSNLLSSVNYTYDETTYPPQVTSNTPNHLSINGSRGNATNITNYSGPTGITKHFDYFDENSRP